MATEYELRLKATLDTTEVRRELERLNAGSRSGASAASGQPGSASAIGTAGIGLAGQASQIRGSLEKSVTGLAGLAGQLRRVMEAFKKASSGLDGFSKKFGGFSKTMDSLKNGVQNVVRNLNSSAQALGRISLLLKESILKMRIRDAGEGKSAADVLPVDEKMKIDADLMGGQYLTADELRRRKRRRGKRGKGPRTDSQMDLMQESGQQTGSTAARRTFARVSLPPRAENRSSQLMRWGLAAFGSQALPSVGEYLSATGNRYAGLVSSSGSVLQGAVMGAGAGALLGPHGASIGALVGTAISATNRLFEHFTRKAIEAREEISGALSVDSGRNARIASMATILRSISQERESSLVAGMGAEELEKVISREKSGLQDVEGRIDRDDYDTVQELETLASSRAWHGRLLSQAQSRLQTLTAERDALDDARSRWEWRESLRTNHGNAGFLRRELRTATERLSSARTAAEFGQAAGDVETLRNALDALSRTAQRNAEEIARDWLRKDSDSRLDFVRKELGRLQKPDFSNVQSLGRYGAYMGESPIANAQEQTLDYLRTQTDLQQQMKQILDSRSFSASWS